MDVRILGIAYHLPEKIETNDDLSRENPDWHIEKIYEKSGIRSRHIAAPDETASDLAFQAARNLIDRELVDPEQIDFILYCTQSPDHFLPSASCVLQHRLSLGRHVGALDFNLGCSGYIYGLYMAKSFVETGAARNVLLLTGDTYSKYINPRDRTLRVLFGDAATATLIGPAAGGPGRIGQFVLGTNGAGAEHAIVPAGCFRLPHSPATAKEITDDEGCTRSQNNVQMNGTGIFSFAITTVPKLLKALLDKTGLDREEIDWYVYHQANKFVIENLASRSKVPAEKAVLAIHDVGNTVSGSIPVAIQAYVESGKMKSGHQLMLLGFGVGLSWGACVLTWD